MGRWIRDALVCGVMVLLGSPAFAGTISLAWDPVPGASSYRVYYGTASGQYPTSVSTSTSNVTLNGLQDCTNYFVAVKAVNSSGVSDDFSNEVSGWSRPTVSSVTPSAAMQGDQLVLDVTGYSFQFGANVDLGNPYINLTSVAVLACDHIQLLATIEPTAAHVRPAQAGALSVTVTNPDSVFGQKSQAFEVMINPSRFDVNRTDDVTRDRIDGKDTVFLSRGFGLRESDPNYDGADDFDGDGWVDGQDLAYIASNLGRCWSAASKTWSLAACPTSLQ